MTARLISTWLCEDTLTDVEGNLLVPIDWRGVLVPGTLPIPRLVRAGSSIAAFTGPPPSAIVSISLQ